MNYRVINEDFFLETINLTNNLPETYSLILICQMHTISIVKSFKRLRCFAKIVLSASGRGFIVEVTIICLYLLRNYKC